MEQKINWLHFSDLHYGQNSQYTLLPKLKWEILKDIERLINNIGPIHIVFFTGDLSQSGSKKEFDGLSLFLDEFWKLFEKMNCKPILIAIPGNHDLDRSVLNKMTIRALKPYSTDVETREEFWLDIKSKGDYYKAIQDCFGNFTDWYLKVNLPKPELKYGIMPGDISASFEIDGLRLNILGLNSAFLEMSNENFKGRLAINQHQWISLTGHEPYKWYNSANLNLLLTHHDSSWYEKDALDFYNNDLNPPDTFFAHLCGHLHDPSAMISGQLGSAPRRLQLAPSLFGLQKINGEIDRIHGYFAGSYLFKSDGMIDSFYPRGKEDKIGGGYEIEVNSGFRLNKIDHEETQNSKYKLKPTEAVVSSDKPEPIDELDDDLLNAVDVMDLNRKFDKEKELNQVTRAIYTFQLQHSQIRVIEQQHFVNTLISKRSCWLITDWGFGEDGFIGSIYHELDIMDSRDNFVINSEDFVSLEDLQDGFNEQFGIPFLTFCSILNSMDNHILIFNQINPMLYQSAAAINDLMGLVDTIKDYCPKTYIILIGREVPKFDVGTELIRLAPLDAHEIRSYVENHPNKDKSLDKTENFGHLFDFTGGLPNHIDNFLNKLRLSTFEEILEDKEETAIELIDTKSINKPLQQAVNSLQESSDRFTLRCYKLLKILTILSYGETLSNLKRFDGSDPIQYTHAIQLEGMSLLEIVTINRLLSQISDTELLQNKVLRVPRHIRDYINTLITEDERSEILKDACNLYFGSKWREGSIKNAHSSILTNKEKFQNVDNCKLVVKNMLLLAIKSGDELGINRAAMLCVNYCEHVYSNDDYKNAALCSEEVFHLLKTTNLDQQKASIAKTYGKSLRMTQQPDLSLEILEEALGMDQTLFSNSERASMLINIGFIHVKKKNYDEAVKVVKDVERLTGRGSSFAITAQYITAESTLKSDQLLKRLRVLETASRKINAATLTNNISISISNLEVGEADRIKRFDKILNESTDNYNVIRAVATKTLGLLKTGTEIPEKEIILLSKAYSYLYNQRMPELFLKCHRALWLICINKGLTPHLLNLYRYSSFFWRIQGLTDLEQKYFDELNEDFGDKVLELATNNKLEVNGEYFYRRKMEFEKSSQALLN